MCCSDRDRQKRKGRKRQRDPADSEGARKFTSTLGRETKLLSWLRYVEIVPWNMRLQSHAQRCTCMQEHEPNIAKMHPCKHPSGNCFHTVLADMTSFWSSGPYNLWLCAHTVLVQMTSPQEHIVHCVAQEVADRDNDTFIIIWATIAAVKQQFYVQRRIRWCQRMK